MSDRRTAKFPARWGEGGAFPKYLRTDRQAAYDIYQTDSAHWSARDHTSGGVAGPVTVGN